MASSARIDGSVVLPGAGDIVTVFSRGWAVDHDFGADPDRVVGSGQPRRISSLGWPAPFDRDLDGVLAGQGAYADFVYVFAGGKYLRLRADTLTPDGEPRDIAGPWSLPASWTHIDAVFTGGGVKSGFAYFFRGNEYQRYDWLRDAVSYPAPRPIAPHWHVDDPLLAGDFDGAITGRGAWHTKVWLFKRVKATVDDHGALVPAGGHVVSAPRYLRYDFNSETVDFVESVPADAVTNWKGLLPLVDSGEAVDEAVAWLNASIAALDAGIPTPALTTAFGHHIMTTSPDAASLVTFVTRLTAARVILEAIPARFAWAVIDEFPAHTYPPPNTRTEVGDLFSTRNGPHARSASLIHEAVHATLFDTIGTSRVDVPEWSGATINGHDWSPAVDPTTHIQLPAYHTISTADALENPSSYAAFAVEIGTGADARYGAGRPQE
ncbi:hemopexin [Frankia sp. QA3]|uniref:hemopexin n=1 Tax=Frankia sp. QA3 TaxID=710111 RepID=UPI000269BC7D|nr:hemopexin [Frankia sp. QA3]EIV92691.1 Hemopexin [Frankia sp. QA3]